ncbi:MULTISPECIES: c-type cytochrome [Pseudomonas]|uniref:Cytochrome C n=1 Tax=Pseudomonas flexibilis TaxID=706570 RepID=A0A0B3BUY5_9PSED|nr:MULTISPECIES: c-type cytochrome [Pseudomonas]KHL69076.1 cytochrome C [Pseudomonas flexibilis]KHO64876.1 cytochrome C [Pseudomonas flexibilis]SCX95834.1 Cytochrome c5 [Pseudomonas flexibilis]SIR01627.1 Cytochrome c5 [Pseudomonas flexibilis]
MNWTKKILVANAAVLALWAVSAQATTNEAIAERLKPVGEVCIQGQECKGVGAVAAAAGGAARSGADVVAKFCNACHGTGLLNSPKNHDTAAWKARADAKGGLDGLVKSAIAGLNAMPPKGTCSDCSDDEMRAAIQEMSGL